MTEATATAEAAPPADGAEPPAEKAGFDDVMLAMDVVDTLRRRQVMVERELASGDREEALIGRLRDIYDAQGIDVPDAILRDGVKALEEKRFVYEPTDRGLQGRLALAYVTRDRWLKPAAAIAGVAAFVTATYQVGFEGPRARAAERAAYELTEVLPSALQDARDAALAMAADDADAARATISALYANGVAATEGEDKAAAEAALASLRAAREDLSRDLTLRVVSRPGERSGVYRTPRDAPGQRNYYLIVEAVDATGAVRSLEIESEEDGARDRAEKWGVRVPQSVYDRVADDKRDDQIIQNDVIGRKPAGRLAPQYDVATAGGAILKW